jgi:hypothetical protein
VFWNKTKRLYGSLLTDGLDIMGCENLKEPQERFGMGIVGFAEFRGCCLDLFSVGWNLLVRIRTAVDGGDEEGMR